MRRILLLAILMLASTAQAIEPIRSPELLEEPREETMVGVAGAEVLLADYELIRRDFPSTRELSDTSIDQWLLRETSFISVTQSTNTEVSEPIPVDGRARTAWRPREYGRAHVFDVGEGLIDVKGTGTEIPHRGDHSNGLMQLQYSIIEFLMEKQVTNIIKNFGTDDMDTVQTYAVIDFGFEIKPTLKERLIAPTRAGLILRQAHSRNYDRQEGTVRTMPSQLSKEMQIKYELFFRRFGITSNGGYRKEGYDIINIQGTTEGALVDFGSYVVRKEFNRNIHTYYEGLDHTDARLAIRTTDPQFIQPDPDLMLAWEIWGPNKYSINNALLQIVFRDVPGEKTTPGVNSVAYEVSKLIRRYSGTGQKRKHIEAFLNHTLRIYNCEQSFQQ